jgi:mono/diheme cytochrome c family protein
MNFKKLILFLMVLAIPATAQVKIQANRAHYVNPTDGQQLYMAFCASCHGDDLSGNTALKQTVTRNINLTQLAYEHPRDMEFRVRYQIEHGSGSNGHPAPMPEWRKILRYSGEQTMSTVAMRSLTSYVVSKQR